MTAVLDKVRGIAEGLGRVPAHRHAWVNALRTRGVAAFEKQGFPTTKQEEWRDTNVAPIVQTPFAPARRAGTKAALELVAKHGFGRQAGVELVFVNGIYEPELSRTDAQLGVRVMSLAEAIERDPLAERHLGQHARIEQHPFAAINTAHLQNGAFVGLGRNVRCAKPIHLLFLTTASEEPTANHPRVLVVAEEFSESFIVETYAGAADSTYLCNAVTEIVLGPGARLDHNKLQQEGEAAYHTALMQVTLARDSAFISHSTSMGSKLTRNDLQVFLGGEGAEATLNGLVYAHGEQHIDNHTLLFHEKGHCPSHELYKHVLADRAMGVFKGKILVQKDAQKTDSKQTCKSLLLSDTAIMNSQPALEIYADDVKCTHGNTTGPVDPNAVFYLISRGLSVAQARHLMTYAFAADITRRIRVGPVRARIEDYMAAEHGLPQDLRITEEAASNVALL
jgi:Fe-S cluster assembly protein SufD